MRSRELARQSRRAQNDVLSTVRVCVRVDKNGQPVLLQPHLVRPTVSEIRKENDWGRLLGAIDREFFWLTTLCLVGLRQRMQTFSYYTEVSLLDVLKVERKHVGLYNLLLPGALATAWLRYLRYLERSRRKILRRVFDGVTLRLAFSTDASMQKRLLGIVIDIVETA